ncbi:MAG: hypothetical protein WDZ79_02080 [Candidatus Paceibacterota bacterium]
MEPETYTLDEQRALSNRRIYALAGLISVCIISIVALSVWFYVADPGSGKKQIAVITTVYRPNSHSDVIAGRLFLTDTLNGHGESFELELASLYVDQFPPIDTSRKHASEYGFPIYDTIRDALTLGTGTLAVDGVLLIAEHGEYPLSHTGQKQYPKRRMFDEIIRVFRESDRSVPIFIDKHLSDNWIDAEYIFETAEDMNIPLMAGSVLPVTYRMPAINLEPGAHINDVVALSYGPLDSYGFHALEMLQSIVERRAGGEHGVSAVQTLQNGEVWEAIDDGTINSDLLESALDRLNLLHFSDLNDLRAAAIAPTAFLIEYADGLTATIVTLPSGIDQWSIAWRYASSDERAGESQRVMFWTQNDHPYMHFTYQLRGIERMMWTGRPAWPAERTLLTSGTLSALHESLSRGGERLETPHLEFGYRTSWSWVEPTPLPAQATEQ